MIGGLVVMLAGATRGRVHRARSAAPSGRPATSSATIARSVPIVITGLGMGFAFRAGAFNIGGEGQMILGALAAAVVGERVRRPAVADPARPRRRSRAARPAARCAWLPGWWQVRFAVPLLITTLLLNYIAALFAAYLVTYPLRDVAAGGLAETKMIPAVDPAAMALR